MTFLEKSVMYLHKSFFLAVILIVIFDVSHSAIKNYIQSDWFDFSMNVTLLLTISHAYLTDWRKKI